MALFVYLFYLKSRIFICHSSFRLLGWKLTKTVRLFLFVCFRSWTNNISLWLKSGLSQHFPYHRGSCDSPNYDLNWLKCYWFIVSDLQLVTKKLIFNIVRFVETWGNNFAKIFGSYWGYGSQLINPDISGPLHIENSVLVYSNSVWRWR